MSHPFSNKMIVSSNVFATVVLNRIDNHVGNSDISTVDLSGSGETNTKITYKLAYPYSLSNSISYRPTALYSTSVEDLETMGCFLKFQEIRLGPKNTA